ncbi:MULTISPECIES: type IV pilus twitching motility protein PilT [Methylophaga]|jgi:twitching motility protein PilT|uniref:type IV pilus twitching motility protein PilT n=1 Tax=Methylophaga TaxID=40222 RepID=UPI000CDC37B9|nr:MULTISPECIES: PilT/PilU family type 4a pilus ATPase [Methylophaga]AUZ84445.1 twitching motility protein [Methylophaga nitratireducenticrescens]|tara:strand:- start:9150 stop:10241 length:1092 start_codon:yes stop_codon:yes gene_type:complete
MRNLTHLAEFEALLNHMVSIGASDMHLSVNTAPVIRLHGLTEPRAELERLTDAILQSYANAILSTEQLATLQQRRSCDLGYTSDQHHRFRINVYYERGSMAFAVRWLDGQFYSYEKLNLPPQIGELVKLKDGLVLVTGATGSGKSTTLATLINEINENRACHILTIEDPIEFIHNHRKAVVHQREVGVDVPSFAEAIRNAMREDPDVILLGEMRDLETMHAAITAAETGHLVFATLHTNDAVGVIDRLIGMFPGEEQNTIRQQLSMALRAVVTQTLVRKAEGTGRVPVNEILIVNGAVSHLIREHNPSQIRSMMETGRALGNQTFEYALAKRVHERLITREQALYLTARKEQFEASLRMLGTR